MCAICRVCLSGARYEQVDMGMHLLCALQFATEQRPSMASLVGVSPPDGCGLCRKAILNRNFCLYHVKLRFSGRRFIHAGGAPVDSMRCVERRGPCSQNIQRGRREKRVENSWRAPVHGLGYGLDDQGIRVRVHTASGAHSVFFPRRMGKVRMVAVLN
jgi:hypothetical protein